MRRILALLCVIALAAGSCGGDTKEPAAPTTRFTQVPAETSEEPTTTDGASVTTEAPTLLDGGTVVIADDQEPVTLNPLAPGGDNFITTIIGQAHLAGAFDIDATTLDLIPELVTELPSVGNGGVTVNDDGTMTVRYQIRDEAVWSDGVPITGYDFEFTLDVLINRREGEIEYWFDVVSTDADRKTFEYTVRSPSAQYETMFDVVVPRHVVDDSDFLRDWNDQMWPAAGPFVFSEWQPGEYIRLTRNENYWKVDPETGEQLPYLDSVEFRFIPETDLLITSFTRREVDVIQPPPSPETIAQLGDLESAGAEVQVKAGPVWEHLNFQFGPANRNPDSMNEYVAFRQAVAYAISPADLANRVGWLPITSMLRPGVETEGPWAQYEQDLDKARELIAQACAEAERDCEVDPPVVVFSTTSNADERPLIAERLTAVLGAVGIEVVLELEDSQLYFGETLENGTWDVGWWAWIAGPGASGAVSALDRVNPDAPASDGGNLYRWGTAGSSVNDESVERFRDILSIVRKTVDPDELNALTSAAEQILAENAVIIPVAARTVVGAVWADELQGYEMNSSQASHTWNIEFWRRLGA